jgi:hypothetical protein
MILHCILQIKSKTQTKKQNRLYLPSLSKYNQQRKTCKVYKLNIQLHEINK